MTEHHQNINGMFYNVKRGWGKKKNIVSEVGRCYDIRRGSWFYFRSRTCHDRMLKIKYHGLVYVTDLLLYIGIACREYTILEKGRVGTGPELTSYIQQKIMIY